MFVEMENPYIFITNNKINNLQEILPILEQIVQSNKPLLLIADAFENEVISTLVLNKLRGTFNVVATKAPRFGDNQSDILKQRIEDALNATKDAVEEGIVIGGGAALVEAYKEVKPQLNSDNVDVQKGIHIVMEALFALIQQIAENAGYNAEDIVESQKAAQKNYGFDAKNGQWVDMLEKGIIDPTKVTRSALLNACSIDSLFITTETGIADAKDTSKNEVPTPEMY